MRFKYTLLSVSLLTLFVACSDKQTQLANVNQADESASKSNGQVHPERWPLQTSPIARDPEQEQRIAYLLAKMSVAEKVGQVIQADIASVTPAEVREYHLGSVLNGGNSAPNGDNRAPAEEWLKLADQFWLASTDTSDGGAGIPVLWGIDAVHGNNNVLGATVFPHNIGLGAANDPDLMLKIGQVTAKEVLVTGIDWTFAPTIAVVQNDRWGRTFESFSERPEIVSSYAGKVVEGIQGRVNSEEFLDKHHLLANVKHYMGDGGTINGIDQGDNQSSEEVMRDIHAAGYPPAIQSGALVVMASFNSWHGEKMHGHRGMLNDILVERMGFDGFVVGDWNGHGQVKGCTNVSCAAAFNAGLDMFMAPDSWKSLYHNTLQQVESGEISQARLDQAVARILRVKLRSGLFAAGLPSERPYAGKFELLGSASHRAVAREAVRKSLVLLKNNQQLLPLSANAKVLVAGSAADNIGQQSGGWTLTWQGTGNKNSDFPNGESIYQGIAKAVASADGKVEFNENGEFITRPDVAIVVFGEQPYAEFQGDVVDVDFKPEDSLAILRKLQAQGIKTVSVFLSGRPMWVNPELNASDAFVAAWLPGTEGGGIADLLFRQATGEVAYDFTGRLSFSWPASPSDVELNFASEPYNPLFAYGYGLSVNDKVEMQALNEVLAEGQASINDSHYLFAGDAVQPWRLVLRDNAGEVQVTGNLQVSAGGAVSTSAVDHNAQEDSVQISWQDQARVGVEGNAVNLLRQSTSDMAVQFNYKVISEASTGTQLVMDCESGCNASLDVSADIAKQLAQGWQQAQIKLSCFGLDTEALQTVNVPFAISGGAGLVLQLSEVKLVTNEGAASCHL
jgi:beta-glucosidase